MNDDKHVDWAGLKYYDAQIKKYVDEVAAKVKQESVSEEQLSDITQRLNNVIELATSNKANIDELFNNDSEHLSNINKLLDSDKIQAENIRELQTRIEYLATKEDFELLDGKINLVSDDVAELEEAVKRDHVTLENLLVALNDKASKQYVDEAISNIPQTNLEQYATKDYVLEKINDAVLSGDVDLSNYYNKETIDAKFSDTDTKIDNNSARIDELVRYAVNNDKNFDELKTSLSTDYYTKSEVNNKIEEVIEGIDVPEVDLSNYYTKDEVDQLIPDDFATKSDIEILNDAVAGVQESLDEKADKTQLVGLATEAWVNEQGFAKTSDIPDTSVFVTNETFATTVNTIEQNITNVEQNYTTLEETVENIENTYVTQEQITNADYVTNQTLEAAGYITTAEATTKIEQIVEEKVQEVVTPESIKYDTWE